MIFCHLCITYYLYEVTQHQNFKKKEKKQCIICAHPGIDPGLLVPKSDILNTRLRGQSKKEGKDQELIQSSTTPGPGYQWESHKFTIRHHQREPKGQPFFSRWPQGINEQTQTKAKQKQVSNNKLIHKRQINRVLAIFVFANRVKK